MDDIGAASAKSGTLMQLSRSNQLEWPTETLAALGLSVSDSVRMFLMRVVADQYLPFVFKVPNVETRAAMTEADEIAHVCHTRSAIATEMFDSLEKVGARKR